MPDSASDSPSGRGPGVEHTGSYADLHVHWNASLLEALPEVCLQVPDSLDQACLERIKGSLVRYGFALLEGIEHRNRDTAAARLVELGSALGRLVPQSPRGERIEDIRDFSDSGEIDDRGYRSRGELTPHSDPPTIILLHCLQPARAGGESFIVNVGAIVDHMREIDPTLVEPLFEAYPHWSVAGVGGRQEAGPSERRRPILSRRNGVLSCVLYRPFLEMAMDALGETLPERTVAALDLFEKCSEDPSLALRFKVRPGQTLLLHNRTVLHGRTDYEDWPDPTRRRHLLRAWIDAPELLPVAPEHELGDLFAGTIEFRD